MSMATLGLEPLRVLCKDAKLVPCSFLVGASGAVGTILRTGFGATAIGEIRGSVVRDSTGQYTITLPGGGCKAIMPVGEPTATGATVVVGRVESINDSTGAVQIQFSALDGSGTATDPASGARVSLLLLVSDFTHIDPDDDV